LAHYELTNLIALSLVFDDIVIIRMDDMTLKDILKEHSALVILGEGETAASLEGKSRDIEMHAATK